MDDNYIDLTALLAKLKRSVEASFPDRLWVRAEVSSLNYRQNGHCYLELSQSAGGQVVSKARATIWASRWPYIQQRFIGVTGSPIAVGMDILVRVQASFHPLYGFSLNIDEVDPQFTLGANELQKKLTIERLTREGLINRQKLLSLPLLPYSLAVVSAPDAAGFGDFRHHLMDNEYGFVFYVRLFEALMQGEDAPSSIIDAFERILSAPVHYDAVLVMRGGGSDLDLACFDDYDLAAAIARCPIPVFTAIGHEKDYHVADMAANTYVKTPTALADLFLQCFISEDEKLAHYESRLHLAFAGRISSMSSRLDLLESRIRRSSGLKFQDALHRIDRLADGIHHLSRRLLDRASMSLDRTEQRITGGLSRMLLREESRLLTLEARINSGDPRKVLERGVVFALDSCGVRMRSATEGRVRENVKMMFADGTVKCTVMEVELKNNVTGEESESLSATS